MTKKTPNQLNAEITTDLPTNGQQLITAAVLRTVLGDMMDSSTQVLPTVIAASPYTVLDSARQNILTINRASPTNVLLPQPGAVTGEFIAGWSSSFMNIGVGTATIIPQGGALINGLASISLPTGFSAIIASNGANYFAIIATAAGVGSTAAGIQFIIDGGGVAITAGIKADLPIPFACTITEVELLADQNGNAVIDIWKDTFAAFPPTVADSITAAAKPTLAATNKYFDNVLTGWTVAINAGDILRLNVDSAATIQRLTVALKVLR